MTEAENRELADYRYTVTKIDGRNQWLVKDMTRTLDTNVAIFHHINDAMLMRNAIANEFLNSRGIDVKITREVLQRQISDLIQHIVLCWSKRSEVATLPLRWLQTFITNTAGVGLPDWPSDPFMNPVPNNVARSLIDD